MLVTTTKRKDGYIQNFTDKNKEALLELMRQYTAMAKKAYLTIDNPWDCDLKYILTVETIKI